MRGRRKVYTRPEVVAAALRDAWLRMSYNSAGNHDIYDHAGNLAFEIPGNATNTVVVAVACAYMAGVEEGKRRKAYEIRAALTC